MNITTPDSYLDDAKNKKRRPGRPKGTGKKVKERIVSHKRPVGRPRRDGLPSGSVSIRPKRVVIQLDDDWGKSLQNEPDSFLSSLVVALSVLPPPVSSGPTAEEAFKSHLNSLAPTSSHNQHLPTLYSILKTFWLPTSPAYFSLTASASARTLSDHRFFYWDPQPLLFNGISCPSCSSSLHNEGRIKRGPLKIYDVERPFYIIGAEYVCKNEGKSFASTDPSILRALPAKLRDELPVRLVHVNDVGSDENIWCWKPAGVSKTLWNLVLGCVRGGLKKDMVIKLIRDTQKGIHQMVEPSKSSNSNEGFTDAYSDAWTANIATADEDNDTQRPDPPTESFSSYNQTSTVSYPSTSIRFKPYEYGPVGGTTQTLSSNGSESTLLHNTAPPVQSLSRSHSVSSSIVSSSAIAGPGHNEQLQTPALLSSSRPSPLSTTISPVPTHSAVDVPPTLSSSSSSPPSTVPRPTNTYPRVQQPLLSSSSNSLNTFSKHVFDYHPAHYALHDQQQQGQQQILHTQPQSHLHIHNPYQQTHTNSASAAHAPGPRNEPMTASLANTPHIHPCNGVDGHPSITGPSSSPQSNLPGVPTFQHISGTSSGPPLSSTPTPVSATTTSSADGSRQPRQRNPRHCSKCGSTTCKGKGGRSYCTNACKDCGRFECRGRNSRRPEKNCEDGWT
ncbi:hypothetical protein F5051DRAFT_454504 [Lentinula edodes]|nr:hypothetical protein F5051DRAFT_454504 [Lentinula edodes]